MRNLESELRNKVVNDTRLLEYGFVKEIQKYVYKTKIYNDQFEMIVEVKKDSMTSRLIDLENGEEYVLVDIPDSTGKFVGKVREDYENILNDIIKKCTDTNVFKSKQAKEMIEYVHKKYGDELEFLWKKIDNNAIWRNKKNNKWYAVLLIVSKTKLGFNSEEIIEIIDLRCPKEKIKEIIDNTNILPGYHMNKNNWITIKLDNSVSSEEIYKLIDNSYELSIGNKCGLVGNELSQKVYDYLRLIPKGKVVTYKQVAEYLGNKGLARVIGNILHKNPDGDKYPCYKVLNSKGELAEAFVFGGKEIQKKLLERDGIKVIGNKVNLNVYQWKEN